MLKIWGRVNSVNVKKAMWCVAELGLEHQRSDAGMQFGVVNTPKYRKMNPTGLVPTIDDDGFTLWESHSIVRYLCAKHSSGKFCPSELRARADAERWMDWAFTFQGAVRNAFWGLIRTPPGQRDPAAIEDSRKKAIGLLPVIEQTLDRQPYVAGAAFTMGDIPIGCEVQRWMRLPLERPASPAVDAWFARLLERPAFRKHVDLPLT